MLFNKFFNCETLDAFNLNLESGDITDQCIVFIEDTKQIWTHGQFYSCPYTKEEIDDLVNSVDTDITKEDIEKVLTGNITSHTHNQYLTSYTETDPTVPAWAKAASKPSYSYSEITNTPTSLKNPTSITIQGNGSSLGSYDGSVAKTINLTYSNVGAAAASHTHTKSQITDFPSTLPNANALTLKINSGTTEGTNLYTYTGSSVKSLDIKAGSNVTLTASSGTLTISSSYTNTTYSAGTGLSLSGTTFSLGTSGVTAGSYGPTTNVSGSNGTTINVPQITVDSYGRVTGVTNRVYTSVDTNTTYSLGSFGVTATAAQLNYCDGVTSNIQTQLNNKAASSHTHTNIVSRGNVTAESGVTGRPAVEGLSMSLAYNNGYPANFGNVISLRGQGDGQIFVGWSGTDGAHAPVYVRSKRDNVTTANWSSWAQFYTSANPQPSVTGSSGSCTGNSATATKLATARTISLTGSVTGSASFDGSANITISTSTNHTHSYLPLSGGTLTGDLTINNTKGFNIGWGTKVTKTSGVWIHGGADAASSTDANLRFGSWWGIGWYPTFSGGNVAQGNNAMWLDVRAGILNVAGGIKESDIYIGRVNSSGNYDATYNGEINNYSNHLFLQHHSSKHLVLCMGGGYSGIGTASPGERLHVVGNTRTDGYFKSTVGTGTQPYQCSSTTLNTNLNADMLDGTHLAGFGGRGGVIRSWSRGSHTKVNQYFGNGNVVTIDPKPTDDTSLSANTTILSLGDNANRNTQLAFFYESDTIRYRRCTDSGWSSWATLLNSSNWTGYVTYIPRDRGSNTVSTLSNLPTTKSTVIANLSAATSISVASGMNVGESITVICNPTASFTQPIPTTGSYKSMDGSSLSVTSGKQFEINIYCYASNTYSISCKVAK